MTDLYEKRIRSTDPRLGRHVAHDPRSRSFALGAPIDRSAWKTRLLRVYDPVPNPNQVLGDCTGCAKAMQFNSEGNRHKGVILGLKDADAIYSQATRLDQWRGSYPPNDTGSDGISAAKAAQKLGLGGAYNFLFGGADEVVSAVVAGKVINVGTSWYDGMFNMDSKGFIAPTGKVAGGHEYTIRGYSLEKDALRGRCWWGDMRDWWIKREHLADLLADDGDAHWQARL